MSSAERLASSNVEFIGIDNSSNERTLPEAYNRGKDLATGKLLLFVHVRAFRSLSWSGA